MTEGHVASRHRLLLIVLWAQIPLLAGLGLATGESLATVVAVALILIVLATAGMLLPNPVTAASVTAIGLISTSAILVLFVPDTPAVQAHFLVMIGTISLYQMAVPLGVGLVALTGFHFTMAIVDPDAYDWTWAVVQSGFAVLLALVLAAGWTRGRPTSTEAATISRLRMAFDEAPLGMAILKPSGQFIQANGALGRLLGYQPEDLVGAHIRAIVHADDMSEVGEAWERMGNDESHSAISWLRCATSSGSSLWGRVSLSLVPRTVDHPALVVMQLEDVTRSYQERRELATLLDGKDEFVAAVGEEMNQPIDRILELTTSGNAALSEIAGEALRIESIVADLVASARIDKGHNPVIALPVDADTLCRDVVASMTDAEGVVIQIGATSLWADPGLTRQVLVGLISHAVRFGGDLVIVRTVSSGPDTVIEVIDDGPEVPDSERERMFRSDLRTGRPLTKPASVGLGLTVWRHLAREMDGDLTYRRTTEGENVFELRLPSEQFATRSRREDIDIPA